MVLKFPVSLTESGFLKSYVHRLVEPFLSAWASLCLFWQLMGFFFWFLAFVFRCNEHLETLFKVALLKTGNIGQWKTAAHVRGWYMHEASSSIPVPITMSKQ